MTRGYILTYIMQRNYCNLFCRPMHFYTVEEFQEDWENMIKRVESGEHIGITNGRNQAVMVPADDELIRIYTDHNEAT